MNAERLLELYEQISEAPDAIARLRRFVLDLAVRGKLVEQESTDETADILLERIAEEKARLVKAGEIKEAKPIALGGKPDFPVPMGWQVVPLGEIIKRHLGGGTPSKNDHSYWDGDILWASVKDVGKSKYLDDTIDRITQKGLENSSSNLVPPGNLIVVTRMGLGQLSINRVPVAINQDLRALFLTQFVDIDFVYNFFLTHGMEGTGLTVKGIKVNELLGIPFPIPPLAEQHRIVAKVDELMALCDRLQEARKTREALRDKLTAASLARLTAPETTAEDFPAHAAFALEALPALTTRPDQIKTLRQTILNLAVRGKLVEQDPADEPASALLEGIKAKTICRSKPLSTIGNDELPFDLPSGWTWTRLGDVIRLISGQHLQPAEYSQKIGGGLPYITGPSDFSANGAIIRRIALVRKAVARRGQLLITVKGSGVGKAMICDLDEVAISRQLMAMEPLGWSIGFLELITDRLAAKLQEEARSLIPGISRDDIRKFVVALPPLAEQHRIVAKVDALMALCDRLEAALTEADTTRTRLLEALLHEALEPANQTLEAAQ
ncbi:restriction endonuclease subunit S [Thioclava nitratireducens]|uniref:restriction endonuclease subunit S n=1 Tax=Thioclava nitratireducens TaxID=1915078 RepID=UPI002480EEFA|nr:restriction endonuclease subunit S [Thioclava nitratireducens]WGT50421.1 restriction endonuclease subunit S [Thioclava nitratireducens]